jgi:uncharacterized membrane protein
MTAQPETFMRKKAKCSMIVWSLTYLVLSPFWFCIGLSTGLNSIHLLPNDKWLFFANLLIVLAVPLSLFLMWFSYAKGYYEMTRVCWLMPSVFLTLALLIYTLLGALQV